MDIYSKIRKQLSIFTLVLLALVWRHYTHQTAFPSHPLLNKLVVPDFCILIIYFSIVLLTIKQYFQTNQKIITLYLVLILIYVALDLNFLMPFFLFYITIWICLLFKEFRLLSENNILLMMRWIVIGVYLSSSLQKFNANFEHIIYPWLIGPFRSYLNISTFNSIQNFVWFIPIWEGIVTILLLFSKTRKIALLMAIVMHVVIIILYSPLHLNYFGPLFPFNISLIFLVYNLYTDYDGNMLCDLFSIIKKPIVIILLVFSIVFPITYYFGIGHAYLCYDLYSGNYRYTTIYFDSNYLQKLPSEYKSKAQKVKGKNIYSICLDSWLYYETYGTIYRSEDSFIFYKNFFSKFKGENGHLVCMIYKNGKRQYELL